MLTFKLAEINPILHHSETATSHRLLYGSNISNKPGLFFVKDSGVYLMSNGTPNPCPSNESTLPVCYAKGHNPNKGDTWEADREECGGDDFTEFIEAGPIRKAINEGKTKMRIKMSEQSYSITFA